VVEFVDLLPEIKTFLETRNEELLDLGFLTDLMAKLNALNNELQGKDRHLSHMISAVNAFKAKLVFGTQLKNGRLTHFPNLEKMSHAIGDKDAFHPEHGHMDKVAAEFSRRFGELDVMEAGLDWDKNSALDFLVQTGPPQSARRYCANSVR